MPWPKGVRRPQRTAAHIAKLVAAKTKHGHAAGRAGGSRTYRSWVSMCSRCSNPKQGAYSRYGGRGITVDPSWADFTVFLADMGERPEGMTLDRIDNSGHYTKTNCRWATLKEQYWNKSNTRGRAFVNTNGT